MIYDGTIKTSVVNIIPYVLYFSVNEIMNPNGDIMNSMVLLHITPFFVFGINFPRYMLLKFLDLSKSCCGEGV